VSKAEVSTQRQDLNSDERRGSRQALGTPRLLPTVSFGIRAAVLAGVVVVSAMPVGPAPALAGARTTVATTVTLGGPIGGLTLRIETTCCHQR
jgi:hypothetical protein